MFNGLSLVEYVYSVPPFVKFSKGEKVVDVEYVVKNHV
jgi:hypothetical protein